MWVLPTPGETVLRADSDMSSPASSPPVRKIAFLVEDTFLESGVPVAASTRRVVGMAVLQNSCAASGHENLNELSAMAVELGNMLMPRMLDLLGSPVAAYGKAAIVGVSGQAEHAAALLHPTLGRPIREAIGGGAALIPSNAKVSGLGAEIDVPLGHRDDAWSFEHLDTITAGLADAPRPDEIVLLIAVAGSCRPNAKVRRTA